MKLFQYILIFCVKLYRWVLSPIKDALFGPAGKCRFTPSCSAYALEALQTHGALRGSWLAVRRVCRCHPWGDFGPDPVPPRATGTKAAPEKISRHHGHDRLAPIRPLTGHSR